MQSSQCAGLPRVSIIILNWNAADETIVCLESLQAATYPAHVLVVDNGSRDGSIGRLAARFPDLDVLALGENTGFSIGVNRGIARALAGGADYVLLLNNDARVAPDMLACLIEYAEAHPECGLISPLIYQLERPERLWVVGGHWKVFGIEHEGWDTLDTGQYAGPTPFDMVFGTGLLIRRALLERIGCFDERFFAYYEDADFNLRARRAGYSVAVVPEARLWHAGSFSTRHHHYLKEFHMARSRVLFFRKYLPGPHFLAFLLLQIPVDARRAGSLLRQGQPRAALGGISGLLSGTLSSFCGRFSPAGRKSTTKKR